MAKYRKILTAYDGSASARHALIFASQLAREYKSWIKVLAVVPTYQGDLELIGVSNIRETIEGPGQKLLAEARAVAEAEDVNVLTNLEQGEPYERIVHVAEDESCDLIVLGRRGLSRVERELMGSVTARVIGYSAKDVLVVPEDAPLAPWRKIVLATDGSKYSKRAFSLALDLAKEREAELTAVSVVYTNDEFLALAPEMVHTLLDKSRAMLDDLRRQAAAAGVSLQVSVLEGEPHRSITQLTAEIPANLIIMGSHGRKGLTRMLMGSVTEKVIGFAPCPVLVAHSL